ncbi:MAG: hypothetical protein AAF705_07510 [Bacteroidota bacterium]
MKTSKFILTLLTLFACCNLTIAQSSRGGKSANQEQYKVMFKVGSKNQLNQASFKTSKGKKLKPTFLNKRELTKLNLAPGTTVWGSFRFNRLSGTDLGSGRVFEGLGTLTFDKIVKPDGTQLGCPPFCEEAVRLKMRLRE